MLQLLLDRTFAVPDSNLGAWLAIMSLLWALLSSGNSRPRLDARAGIADISAVAYLYVQVLTLLTTKLRPGTLHFITPYVCACCIYFAIRLASNHVTVGKILATGVALSLLTALADVAVWTRVKQLADQFPSINLSTLRAWLPVPGGPTRNDGVMIALAVLPYPFAVCLLRQRYNGFYIALSALTCLGLFLTLVLSFSRGAYLATSLFIITCLAVSAFLGRTYFRNCLTVCLLLFLGAIASVAHYKVGSAVHDTLAGVATTSERRSNEGRKAIWVSSLPTIAANPFLGSGGGTDGLAGLARLSRSDLPFTARIYNVWIEVAFSSGILGLVAYGAYLITPLVCLGSRLKHWRLEHGSEARLLSAILGSGILALLVRDMGYSSLVLHGATIVIAWITIGLVVNFDSEDINPSRFSYVTLRRLAVSILIVSTGVLALCFRQQQAERFYDAGRQELRERNDQKALINFQQASDLEQSQPAFLASHGFALSIRIMGGAVLAESWKHLPDLTPPQRIALEQAASDYNKALTMSNADATLWSNLGWIMALLGHDDAALQCFQKAKAAEPRDGISRIGLGLFLERKGDSRAALTEYAAVVAATPRVLDSEFFDDLAERNPAGASKVISDAMHKLDAMPRSPITLAASAKLHATMGATDAAEQEYMSALHDLPNLSYGWSNLGVLYGNQGKLEKASICFKRALFLDETNMVARKGLALAELAAGEIHSAENEYSQTHVGGSSSVHAERSWRVYHVAALSSDDILPQGLLDYAYGGTPKIKICGSWLFAQRARVNSAEAKHDIDVEERGCGFPLSTSSGRKH